MALQFGETWAWARVGTALRVTEGRRGLMLSDRAVSPWAGSVTRECPDMPTPGISIFPLLTLP